MGRRTTLTVEKDTPLTEDRWYPLEVASIEVKRRQKEILVTLRHTNGEQEGRTHVLALPLPVRPSSKAGEFFRACGFEIAEGAAIEAEGAVGRKIQARFHVAPHGEPQVAAVKEAGREDPK